jgi:hypothetical protein
MKSQMRLTRTSGSVGGLGGRPPRSTRPKEELELTPRRSDLKETRCWRRRCWPVRATHSVLNWHGTATEFLEEVGKLAGTTVTRSAGWPKTPRALMNEMRRIAPQLRSRGLFVSFDRTREKRVIVVRNQIWQDRFSHT